MTAFSQTATDSIPVKVFPIPVVKLIIKDLMKGDSAINLLHLTETQLKETEHKVVLKDSVINTMLVKELNYNKIIESERSKYTIMETYSKDLEKQLRIQKVKNKFTKIVAGGAMAAMAYFLILHK